ncbi:DUF6702 family protein [Tenacibaculum agarivorans]|uniref:DUF6702 family protein n=1 Tax=Tenacibaculum agarivorans TaxID=1908389 RepID=UPI00094B94A2|nr:DUF6702 family protein [Tenacibaculum agarivorans]
MKFQKIIYCLLILISFSFKSYLHEYYIALTEIEYNSKNKSVEMIMNVFVDNIEEAINKEFNADMQLTTKKEVKNADDLFHQYLKKHFKIYINGKQYDYKFIGKEYERNLVYFYLEIENVKNISTLKIENDVLTKDFPDQQNLIKATINKKREVKFLTKKNNKCLLNF